MERALRSRLLSFVLLAGGAAWLSLAGCSKSPLRPVIVPPLDSVRVSPDTLALRVGESALFSAVAYDTNGAVVSGVAFAWTTNDTDRVIVTIDGTGRVRALSEGTVLAYAELGGRRDSAVVVVGPASDGWYTQTSNANGVALNGVFFLPDARTGWAVGNGGKIVTTGDGGVTWSLQVSNTSFNLMGVWFTNTLEGWATGAGGTVLHTDDGGVTWTRITTSASEVLNDVYFYDALRGWVVGTEGVILRTRNGGATWTEIQPSSFDLNGVAFVDTTHGWAVGDGGVILGTHNGGTSWFTVPAITAQNLRAVARRSESLAWAAGDLGVAPRTTSTPDSTAWQLANAGASNQLDGVHFPSNLVGYTVGYNGVGAVLKTVNGGASWTPQTANTQFRLNDVFFVDDEHGWAVGVNGTIVHTGTGGTP